MVEIDNKEVGPTHNQLRSAKYVCEARGQRWMKLLENSAVGFGNSWMRTVLKTEVGTREMKPQGGYKTAAILRETLVPLKTGRKTKDHHPRVKVPKQVGLFEEMRLALSKPSGPVPEPPVGLKKLSRAEVARLLAERKDYLPRPRKK